MPCGTLNDAAHAGKPFVKVAAGLIVDNKTTSIDGEVITILADPGAKLDRSNDGIILEVKNDADVRIYDLEITGGTGLTDPAISVPAGGSPQLTLTRVTVDRNQGIGISVVGGVLTVSRSTIAGNAGGGISAIGGQFDITNAFIVGNGGASSVYGGIKVDAITAMAPGVHRIDFNTIAMNRGPAAVDLGIACGTVLTLLTFSNNIVYANSVAGIGKQVSANANCSTSYSDIGPDPATGIGNINLDPQFVDPTRGDFHLRVNSPAKDAADLNADLGDDFDGDTRPQSQGGRRDMGADEVTP